MGKKIQRTCSHTCGINGVNVPERTYYRHQGTSKKLLAQAQAAQALTLSDNNPPSSPVSTGLRYAQGHSAYDSDSDSSRSGDSFHSRIESSKNHNDAEMEDGEDGNDLEREEEDFSAPSDSLPDAILQGMTYYGRQRWGLLHWKVPIWIGRSRHRDRGNSGTQLWGGALFGLSPAPLLLDQGHAVGSESRTTGLAEDTAAG
ncbi:hypothetical protein B0H14DRAFT_3693741 [Mycena olivaceomarginata]|nr:hypothetical protein B0H14DRAFT_3693741 [Mycena olivaceomarginata]